MVSLMISSTSLHNAAFGDLVRLTAELDVSPRVVIGIAGAPASGKSTLAERLVSRLNEIEDDGAASPAMDGHHRDDRVLTARGWRRSEAMIFPMVAASYRTAYLRTLLWWRNDGASVRLMR